MKILKTVLLVLSMAFMGSFTQQAQNTSDDVFIPIVKYLSVGDIDNLAAWFPKYLDVSIPSSKRPVSRAQGIRILQNFLGDSVPSELSISHTATKGKFKYAVGDLVLGGEHYYISITLSLDSDKSAYFIKQIKITR